MHRCFGGKNNRSVSLPRDVMHRCFGGNDFSEAAEVKQLLGK